MRKTFGFFVVHQVLRKSRLILALSIAAVWLRQNIGSFDEFLGSPGQPTQPLSPLKGIGWIFGNTLRILSDGDFPHRLGSIFIAKGNP